MHRAYNRVREHNFSLVGLLGFDLHGKTVGVVGTGTTGAVFARIMLGFGCEVLAYDPHPNDECAVARLRDGVMVINTSRGALVETTAVIDGLNSGRIGHLGLDVYEEEETLFFQDLSDVVVPDDVFARLLTFPNVLVTGHQAFFTGEALTHIAETTLESATAFATSVGELHAVVDPR